MLIDDLRSFLPMLPLLTCAAMLAVDPRQSNGCYPQPFRSHKKGLFAGAYTTKLYTGHLYARGSTQHTSRSQDISVWSVPDLALMLSGMLFYTLLVHKP